MISLSSISSYSLGFATVTTILATGVAEAAIITVPTGLNPGDQYRLAFVTDGTRNATSTNIEDYNTFVRNDILATSALQTSLDENGLTPEWFAIGSTEDVSAIQNTGTDPNAIEQVPTYLISDSIRVANDYSDLWDGSIQNTISITPNDNDVSGLDLQVFSGTLSSGDGVGGFFLGSGSTRVGEVDSVSLWIGSEEVFDDNPRKYYGISSVLVVPDEEVVSTSESSSPLSYIILGGLILGGLIRRASQGNRI